MKVIITAMRRYGTHWKITLECGHTRVLTVIDVKREQLYLGKRIECTNHATKSKRA